MKNYKFLFSSLTLILITLLMACKPEGSTEVLYPENEIPVTTESKEALKQFVDGLKIMDEGNAQNAKAYFEKALEADPNFVSAQFYKTFTSTSAKEFADNCSKAQAMAEHANDGEKLMLELLNSYMTNDDMEEMRVSKAMVEAYPNSSRAYENLGFAYSSMDEEIEARNQFQKAIDLNPKYLPAYNSLGGSYMFSEPKDLDKAEMLMSKMLELSPENPRAHIALGDCYRAQKDLDKALERYLSAAEHDDSDPVAHSKAGHVNSLLGNYDDARKNYQLARERSTHGTGSINFEAYTHLYGGDQEAAVSFLETMIGEVDQMDIPDGNKTGTKMNLLFNCAMIAMHQGDSERMKNSIESMKPLSDKIAEDLGNDESRRGQKANMQRWDALSLAIAGDYEAAKAMSEEMKNTLASNTNPNKLRGYHFVNGVINLKEGNAEAAVEHFSQTNLDNVYNKYMLAKATEKLGKEEEAIDLYKQIVDNNFNGVGYALIRNELKEKLSTI